MKKEFLEAGKIVNTHGIRGEIRIQPWADSAEFLQGFEHLYIDGVPIKLLSGRVHKSFLIAQLDGVADIGAAIALKNKLVYIRRSDAVLPEGDFFIQDILGLPVVDEAGEQFGTLKEVLPRPGGDVYVIVGDGGEHLVPDVPAFILEKNLDEGFIRVRLIEGL
ncbi:MAG: ribosome maturation factor RimM [Oscillospiraceae bacterium]|nr:ribosome maturation factor RimM [Oscillospiraceae bacterium]